MPPRFLHRFRLLLAACLLAFGLAMPAAAADALAVATPGRQTVWQAQPLTRRLQADPPPGGQSMPYSNVEARPKSWGRENWGG